MLLELSYSLQRALIIIGTVHLILTAAIATVLCISIFFLARMGVEFFRFRGRHMVHCPETGNLAIIRISALHAAVSSLLADPQLCVNNCSRWPQRKNCGQECLSDVHR
jgi:hypothetical protein